MMTTKRLLFQSVSQCEIIFLSLESAVTLLLYLFKFTVITMYVTWYCISRCWYVYRRNERENTVGRSLRKISESVTEFETWIKCAREPGAFCAWHGHTESKVTRAYIQNNAIIFRQPLYILRYATSYVSLDVTMAIWTCVCSSLLLSISLYVYMLYGSRIPSSISFWRFITHSISSSSFSLFWSLERSLLFAYIYTYIYIRFAKPNVGLVTRCCCCRLYPLLFSPLPPYLKLLLLLLLLLALTTVVDVSPFEVDFSLHCAWMWIVEASDFSPFAANRKTHWWADEL